MTTDLIAQAEAVSADLADFTEDDAYAEPWAFGETCQTAAAVIPALIARIRELEGEREAHHANPADFRYWEGRWRDEAAKLAEVEKERDEAKTPLALAWRWQCRAEIAETERDELRAAIFGSPDYAPELRNGNFREMAETLHAAQKHGQATVATLTARVEAMRGAIEYVLDGYGLNAPDYKTIPGEHDEPDWIVEKLRTALTTENKTNG